MRSPRHLAVILASYKIREGARPAGAPPGNYDGAFTDDLDRFGGRTGVTPEFLDGTYYYVLTEGYPFIPREHHGTPDPSFSKGPGGPGGDRMGGPPRGEHGEGGQRPPPRQRGPQ